MPGATRRWHFMAWHRRGASGDKEWFGVVAVAMVVVVEVSDE